MEGLINPNGVLLILRENEWKPQICPFSYSHRKCGDECPHFGKPPFLNSLGETRITICQGRVLFFEKFEDFREKNDGNQNSETSET